MLNLEIQSGILRTHSSIIKMIFLWITLANQTLHLHLNASYNHYLYQNLHEEMILVDLWEFLGKALDKK